ncbi:hypothetical protein DAPPUDRAFT_243328 [Daphnia pulex]|uniref:Uncharacterized protein n=1 Tax=Daphnia pulex TaxID=6669 RepID=E9GIH5_DAPPU|nr:hypothetical protein DAPPUDRAFT_243328 [Daphnia pulex]|eukprot:EFX80762.1 hypothetical protein DAPPUDRAFT_243328 [Daphnia pulex]
MKLSLIFFFIVCLAVIAVKAQTKTTLKSSTTKGTTLKATTLKTTTGKTNGTTMTTRKPVTTTAASAIKSYKVCRDTTSTAATGSIQPLDGLTPVATGPPKTCNFSITAPTNHSVQMSCSLANLTVTSIFFNASSSSTFSRCQDSETDATNGSIQAIRETLNGTTYKNVARLCPFFINLPPNGQIQMSCPFNASSQNFLLLTFCYKF